MLRQRTLKQPIRASGVGLHSGLRVEIHLKPAPEDHGIVFRRLDLQPAVNIPVNPLHITDTRLATTLSSGLTEEGLKYQVQTIEHLMSALFGLGVDNALIEVTALEIPILDGSSGSFVVLLRQAGVVEQHAAKTFVAVKRPVVYQEGDCWVRLDPFEGFKTKFQIDFGHPAIDATGQDVELDFSRVSYVEEIARARTFGFMQDVDFLRAKGLARGGNLNNAIVMDEFRVLNDDGLRYSDEFARHKILDAIGDLYVLGKPLLAAYSSRKGGHKLNNLLLRQLLSDQSQYEIRRVENKHLSAKIAQRDWVTA